MLVSARQATQSEVDDMVLKYDFIEDVRPEGPAAPPPGVPQGPVVGGG